MIEVRVCAGSVCCCSKNRESETTEPPPQTCFICLTISTIDNLWRRRKKRNRKSKWIIHEAYFSFLRVPRGCCIIPAEQNGSLHLHRHRQRLNPLPRWFIQHKIIWIRIQRDAVCTLCQTAYSSMRRVLCVPSCSIPCVVYYLQLCRTFSVCFSSILICVLCSSKYTHVCVPLN